MVRRILFDRSTFDSVTNLRIVADRTVGSLTPLPCYFPHRIVDIRDGAEGGEVEAVERILNLDHMEPSGAQ